MFDGWGEAFALSCSRQIRLRLSGKCFHVAQPGGIGGDRRVETVPKSQEKRVRVFSPLLLAASYPALSNIPRQLPSFCYVNCFKLGPSWLRLFSIFIVFLTFSSLPSYLSNTIILVQNSRPRAFSPPPLLSPWKELDEKKAKNREVENNSTFQTLEIPDSSWLLPPSRLIAPHYSLKLQHQQHRRKDTRAFFLFFLSFFT